MKRRYVSAREYVESFPLLVGHKNFSYQRGAGKQPEWIEVSDFRDFAEELRRELVDDAHEPERPGAKLNVLRALNDCENGVTKDHEAELVLRGYRLGAMLAEYERERHWRSVADRDRARGRDTKHAKIQARNARMIEQYRRRAPVIGCLETRRELRSKFRLTLTSINAMLRASGIKLGTL